MGELVDVDRVRAPAFALRESMAMGSSDWHAHRKHQLLYASEGMLRLEAAGQQWFLPPQRAAWIRASVLHRVHAETRVSLRTIYFAPEMAAPHAALHAE